MAVARAMKRYEDELYEEWLDSVSATLPGLLKKTVLTKPPSAPLALASSHSLQHLESRSGTRPHSRAEYSYLFPPGNSFA